MSKEILMVVETVSLEKDIDKATIFEALESALVMATKKRFLNEVDLEVNIDRDSGDYQTYRCWAVVDDDAVEDNELEMGITVAQDKDTTLKIGDKWREEIESERFGRIAAQTAKQVIIQKVKAAERAKVVEEFQAKVGSLINGQVKRVTRDNIILDLGRNAEAVLARSDMIPNEITRIGDRVKAYLFDAHYELRGPQMFVSRVCNEMLMELFRIEVPEIGEEIIQVKGAARDPGLRAKIAVKTNDKRIDPVGACVGMRGARVQAVSEELGGERVDIILWDDNPAQLVINAMAPAEIASIIVKEESHEMDLAVEESQLSQAIGRNGQNIRLASELTGWKLNVMSTEEAASRDQNEVTELVNMFKDQLVIDESTASILVEEGFSAIEEIAYVPLQELLDIEQLEEDAVRDMRKKAQDVLLEVQKERENAPQPAEDLLALEGMSEDLAYTLASHKIITREDLAECAVDELLDLEGFNETNSAALIMKAREHWFSNDEE